MTYNKANEKLQGRNKESRKVGNNTYLQRRGENIAIKFHKTDIIVFKPNDDIVLDTDGWKTVTTKERLNEFLPSGFSVYSNKGVWFLGVGGYWDKENFKEYVFEDGITIKADGKIEGEGENPKVIRNKIKKINAYCQKYIKALVAGKVKAPSGGDCWYCCMKTEDGKTLGEANKDTSHLEEHIRQLYFVPSLLWNAIQAFPVSPAARYVLASYWNDDREYQKANHWNGIASDQLGKSLKRYLKRQFKIAA